MRLAGGHGTAVRPGRSVAITAAIYDPATHQVTLTLRTKLHPQKTTQLEINGTSGGVASTDGVPLNSPNTTKPGQDYLATLDLAARGVPDRPCDSGKATLGPSRPPPGSLGGSRFRDLRTHSGQGGSQQLTAGGRAFVGVSTSEVGDLRTRIRTGSPVAPPRGWHMRHSISDRTPRVLHPPRWLATSAAGVAALSAGPSRPRRSETDARADGPSSSERGKPTRFQIACMTLPYSPFPLDRALSGIKAAGYRYVAWGTTHRERGRARCRSSPPTPLPNGPRSSAGKCRDLGLEPLMMFSTVYPEADDAVESSAAHPAGGGGRVAAGADLRAHPGRQPQALGRTVQAARPDGPRPRRDDRRQAAWRRDGHRRRLRRDHPRGGRRGDQGQLRRRQRDGLPRRRPARRTSALRREVRGFCIKDHRNFPKDEDCGPGFGEIDHYKLLQPVAFTGRNMPLCCENIFAPLSCARGSPRASTRWHAAAREFLEW